MLSWLETIGVGPCPRMRLDLGPRFNLITGDNGLGKSFLLEVAWWALTGTWAGEVATPTPHLSPESANTEAARVRWRMRSWTPDTDAAESSYHPLVSSWVRDPHSPNQTGLVLFARSDGSFSVFDPAKPLSRKGSIPEVWWELPDPLHFRPSEVWQGLGAGTAEPICEGLLRDWVSWELKADKPTQGAAPPPFTLLRQALARLSPHASEAMTPGPSTRILGGGSRDVPVVRFPYGDVPLQFASSAVRQISALTYLLIWTWYEHLQRARTAGQAPERRLLLLWDEVETHLHPRWQRTILPAVMDVVRSLGGASMDVQVLATTHSPLVLASMESVFDDERDRMHHLRLDGARISLRELLFAKQGDATNWLLSDAIGLDQARSLPAEEAIEAAEAWMRGDHDALPETLRSHEDIHERLLTLLPAMDPFWARWDGP